MVKAKDDIQDIIITSALIVQSHDDRGVVVLIVMGPLRCSENVSIFNGLAVKMSRTHQRDGHVGLINS